MAGWTLVSRAVQYEARPGQDMVTEVRESLEVGQTPVWRTGSFNRELSESDGKAIARESFYQQRANNDTSYVIRGAVSQEPIATHPMFQTGAFKIDQAEWRNYRKWQADPGSVSWSPDNASSAFKKFYELVERGVESFLAGTVEVQITEVQPNQPRMRDIGRIEAPPNAPILANGRNWIVVGLDADRLFAEQGRIEWRVVTTYRASAAGGWNRDIYTNT